MDGWAVYRKKSDRPHRSDPAGLFAFMAATSFIPPWVNPMYHPMTGVDPQISYSTGPSLRHWLGTDFIGRDIFSQLLAGARIAFMVGISSALISILFGTTIGMVAGYAGRRTDLLLMRLADMIMVMPTLLVVLICRPCSASSISGSSY
jgi:peptide/nickel transport system permease protein